MLPALFVMNGAYLLGVISTNDYGKTLRQVQAFHLVWAKSVVFIVSHFQGLD